MLRGKIEAACKKEGWEENYVSQSKTISALEVRASSPKADSRRPQDHIITAPHQSQTGITGKRGLARERVCLASRTMPAEPSLVFYDIASSPPLRTFAANPWKTRFALNFKGVAYRTQWVQMPNISAVREQLHVPANRTLPDGSPYHTLPVIQDTESGVLVGDSFEIALYLDDAYPEAPRLFRTGTTGLTAAFNARVDGLFTTYAILCSQMPFDAEVAEAVKEIFAKRAGAMSVDMNVGPDQRKQLFVSFEADLGELAKAYRHTGGTTDYFWRRGGTEKAQSQRAPSGREEGGPFLDGDEPTYADFIVGAWLKMFETSMPPEEWQRVRTWQGGLWGRLADALGKWSEIK